MKRIVSITIVALFFILAVASCASSHAACDAYSSNYTGAAHNDVAMVQAHK